ncbi:GIN domain-containing protein [Pedobacter metabolipauper]|uniref:Putative auto-transporter adhesin head GIN domain-containing protein n=1 Tax=Pedobacter metabolipauper TaxID=425513 RepID=A0A4R6SW20_9SPHI|nr:DUF2807 domain-containing protein [Pedobacter metabolipauper]TDQ09569.1 hypothetical protein ATK78_1725 [Pedobacter metabolipauper]
MKNSIKKSISAIAAIVILGTVPFRSTAATPASESMTVLSSVKNIQKIVVTGNVDLILIQSAVENVKVYDNYYSNNALVQQQNGTLRISSFNSERLTVVAYVNNISSIDANENAQVRTIGKFNLINLNVVLKNNASANITSNTVNLFSSLDQTARLNLTGTTENHMVQIGNASKLVMDQFAAQNTNMDAKIDTKPAYKVNPSFEAFSITSASLSK